MRAATLLLLAATAAGAQVTAGTRSADDQSRETAFAQRIAAAESALEKGDYKAAEAQLRQLAHDKPQDAQILYDLGFAQERNNEPVEAAENYQAAITAAPSLPQPRLALGLLEARLNHPDAARAPLNAVADDHSAPSDLRGRALRALARLDEQANPSQASDELLQAIKLTGETAGDTAFAAELAAHSGDTSGAEAAYRKTLAANPSDPEATVGFARTLRQSGKSAEAEQLLTAAQTAHPDDPGVVAELADLYATENKNDEAIALVEALRSKDPQAAASPPLTAMLARLYAGANRFAEAESLYRSLLVQTPNDPGLLDALGGVLLRQAKYPESEQILKRAFDLRPEFHDDKAWAETATHLALAAQRNREPAVTLQALAARATVLPDSAASLFLQATANDALHHNKEAERLYRAFLSKAGGMFPDEEFEARHRLIALDHAK